MVEKVAAMLAAFAEGPAHSVRDFARRAGLSRSAAPSSIASFASLASSEVATSSGVTTWPRSWSRATSPSPTRRVSA